MPTRKPKVQLSSDEIFENAYSLYRKNENRQALAEIAKGDQNAVNFMELKAQLLYRLEQFDGALELFNHLINNHSDEFDETRRANLIAVHAAMAARTGGKYEPDTVLDQDSFEQLYNNACFLIFQSNFTEAIKLLDKASVKCREMLTEDGLTEEEIQEELSVILAQKAYALQKLGLIDDALKIYNCIVESNISDANVKVMVFNNLQCIEPPFADRMKLSKARFELTKCVQKKRTKLSQTQKIIITSNLKLLKSNASVTAAAAAIHQDGFQEIVTSKLNKRKRKPRLPKNYDPNVPPDPERWLPRNERSTYRKKLNRKFKDRDIGRGTQGAAQSASNVANIDYSKGAPQTIPTPPTVENSPKPSEGPRQQRMAQKKNKKRKGGKW